MRLHCPRWIFQLLVTLVLAVISSWFLCRLNSAGAVIDHAATSSPFPITISEGEKTMDENEMFNEITPSGAVRRQASGGRDKVEMARRERS